jgi:hypothetical protein
MLLQAGSFVNRPSSMLAEGTSRATAPGTVRLHRTMIVTGSVLARYMQRFSCKQGYKYLYRKMDILKCLKRGKKAPSWLRPAGAFGVNRQFSVGFGRQITG